MSACKFFFFYFGRYVCCAVPTGASFCLSICSSVCLSMCVRLHLTAQQCAVLGNCLLPSQGHAAYDIFNQSHYNMEKKMTPLFFSLSHMFPFSPTLFKLCHVLTVLKKKNTQKSHKKNSFNFSCCSVCISSCGNDGEDSDPFQQSSSLLINLMKMNVWCLYECLQQL